MVCSLFFSQLCCEEFTPLLLYIVYDMFVCVCVCVCVFRSSELVVHHVHQLQKAASSGYHRGWELPPARCLFRWATHAHYSVFTIWHDHNNHQGLSVWNNCGSQSCSCLITLSVLRHSCWIQRRKWQRRRKRTEARKGGRKVIYTLQETVSRRVQGVFRALLKETVDSLVWGLLKLQRSRWGSRHQT